MKNQLAKTTEMIFLYSIWSRPNHLLVHHFLTALRLAPQIRILPIHRTLARHLALAGHQAQAPEAAPSLLLLQILMNAFPAKIAIAMEEKVLRIVILRLNLPNQTICWLALVFFLLVSPIFTCP